MINRFLSWPIRTHLIFLLLLFTLPSIWVIVHLGLEERAGAIDEAKKDCLKLVNTIAIEQQAVAAGVEQLVTTLALLPEVRSQNRQATDALLSQLLKKNPHYANLGIADKSGLFWASAVPFKEKVSVADRKYFRDAVRTGMLSSGEYTVGRFVNRPVMNFGYPVKNASNELTSVIVVALDLDFAQRNFEKRGLPPGASFSLLDHQGTILIRNLKDTFSEKLVGKRDVNEELFTQMKGGNEEGTSEAMGNDGNYRLMAYKKIRLPHESEPYIYARSSIPLASVTSKANAAVAKRLSLLMLLFGAGLFLVWFIGKRAIMDPIMRLKKASQEFGAGAGSLNVSQVVKDGELGDLARTFDRMAEAMVQREDVLRKSEQRWATTLASIGDAVIATDLSGKVTFMNRVAEELTGWTLSKAFRKPAADVFHIVNENTRNPVEDPVSRVLKEGAVVGLANHTVLLAKDGREIPIDDSGAPIRDRDGTITGVVLVFRDITERKRAEDALREAHGRAAWLARFPEQNPNPVIRASVDGTILYCNPSAAKLRGWECEIGQVVQTELLPLVSRAMAEGNEVQEDLLLDGRFYIVWIAPFPGEGYVNVYARDITERKRAEQALRESEERFKAIASRTPDHILVQDRELRYVFVVNPQLGLTEQDMIGKTDYDILSKADADKLAEIKRQVIRTGKPVSLEAPATNLKGEVEYFSGSYVPRFDSSGATDGLIGYFRNITERKRTEEALRKAHDELEKRVQERTSDLSEAVERVRVENIQRKLLEDTLRQSESQVRFFASQCLTAQETERKRVAGELHDSIASALSAMGFRIDKITHELKQGQGHPESLLDLRSTVVEINNEVRRIMVDLRPSILDDLGIIAATDWFCREYQKSYSHISVEKQIGISESEVPDSLKTPIFRISQEAMNNIAKYSQASLVNLSLQKEDKRILLTIQDNGQGFNLETVRKGMGLSTMRERALLSGGTFGLESVIGKGTTIRVSWSI